MKAVRDSTGRRVSTWMAIAVIVMLLAGGALLQYSIDNANETRAGWEDSSPFNTARSLLDILGGMRESLASNLWSKTDVVFHEYLGGNIGNEYALYPYYWLITRLDPHFTMAYYYASWMLARMGHVEQGFDLALEGLRYNPYSARLNDNLASIYFYFKKDPKKAKYHMLKAISLTTDEQEKAVYENLLKVIDKVIAGERKIPDIVPLQQLNRLNEQLEETEQHQHDHNHRH